MAFLILPKIEDMNLVIQFYLIQTRRFSYICEIGGITVVCYPCRAGSYILQGAAINFRSVLSR